MLRRQGVLGVDVSGGGFLARSVEGDGEGVEEGVFLGVGWDGGCWGRGGGFGEGGGVVEEVGDGGFVFWLRLGGGRLLLPGLVLLRVL